MGRVIRSGAKRSRSSLVPPIVSKGTSGPYFRAVMVGGMLLFVLTLIAVRYFHVNSGWIAVVVGALATAGLMIYLRVSARRAREELERKRAEFYRQFEESDPHE